MCPVWLLILAALSARAAEFELIQSVRGCIAANPAQARECRVRGVVTIAAPGKPSRRWWVAGVAALAVANAVDAHSSWGRLEANPMLRSRNGTFGARAVALKGGFIAGLVAVEHLLIRRRPGIAGGCIAGNFAAAGVIGAAAAYNYRVER